MTFDKEFKEALAHLPEKEKDKLLLRLLKKDLQLANRLRFELVSTKTVDDRRAEMEERVEQRVKRFSENFYSIGYLNMDVRYLSGEITEHVKITKDKFGEASLNLLLLIEVLEQNNKRILNVTFAKARKLCVALIARVFKVMLLIDKLDTDFFIEFAPDLKKLGRLVGANDHLMRNAIHHGLDVNWLLTANFPEDLVEMHKELRANGYLK